MKRFAFAITAMMAFAGTSQVQAGNEFGTDAEVRSAIDELIAHAKDKGIPDTIVALKDASTSLGAAKPGLMIWVNGVMEAHNKFPDLSGVPFEGMQDLRGQYIITDFTANANAGGDYSLNYWPAYNGEAEYEYHCFSKWVEKDKIMATACR